MEQWGDGSNIGDFKGTGVVYMLGGFRCDISSPEESTQNQNQTGFMRLSTLSHEIDKSENVKAKPLNML